MTTQSFGVDDILLTLFGHTITEVPDSILCRINLNPRLDVAELTQTLQDVYGLKQVSLYRVPNIELRITAPYNQLIQSAAYLHATGTDSHGNGVASGLVDQFYSHREQPRVIIPLKAIDATQHQRVADLLSDIFAFHPPAIVDRGNLLVTLAQMQTLRSKWHECGNASEADRTHAAIDDMARRAKSSAPHGTPQAEADQAAADATLLGAGLHAATSLGLTPDESMRVLGLDAKPETDASEQPAPAAATPSPAVEGEKAHDGLAGSKVVHVNFTTKRRK